MRRSAMCLLMVLIVLTVCGILSAGFLASQSTSVGLARNIGRREQAARIGESAIELALGYIRSNADWRSRLSDGPWSTAQPLMGGTFDLVIRDGVDGDEDGSFVGDANLRDDPTDPFTLLATARVDGITRTVRAVVTPVDALRIRVVMVVANAAKLTTLEQERRDLLEGWDWEVRVIDDDASDAAFAQEVDDGADVLYVTGGVNPRKLAWAQGKLAVGLAWERGRLGPTFRLSSGNGSFRDDEVSVVSTGYPITESFSAGAVQLVAGAVPIEHPRGRLAPSAVVLATRKGRPGTPTLVMIEKGGTLSGGRVAAGRRVCLPFGAMPTSALTDDGRNLLKASLLWAGQTDPAANSKLVNGGLESSRSDGDSLIDPGWQEFEGEYVQLVTKTTGSVHGGTYAAKFDFEYQGGLDQQMIQRVSGLTAGKSYALAAYVRMVSINHKGWAGSGLQISAAHSESGAPVGMHDQNVVTSDWKRATFTAPASDQGQLWIRVGWYGVNTGVAYVDDVTLVDPGVGSGRITYEVRWKE